jgi:hypothetical protein
LIQRLNSASNIEGQPINGPLAELINGLAGTRRSRATARRRPAITKRTGGSRTLFLAELEITGDTAAAARIAGCSMDEVRAWRAADPMFDRDYALALTSHLRALKRMVGEIGQRHESPQVRQAAQHLLGTEPRYIGVDGRLDARAWRDALASFAHSLGIDLSWWEPASEDDAEQESEPSAGSSAA